MEQLRLPPAGEESRAAFATLKSAKNWFWILILLCAAVQLTAFVLVRVGGVIDSAAALADRPGPSINAEPATRRAMPTTVPAPWIIDGHPASAAATGASRPASAPATAPGVVRQAVEFLPVAPPPTRKAQIWYDQLQWILPASKFLAMVCSLLLTVTLLLGLQLAMVGRTGGAGPLASSLVWSLVLAVLLLPWRQILPDTSLTGALFGLEELLSGTQIMRQPPREMPWAGTTWYYARFVGYPVVALLVWSLVGSRFTLGYRRMRVSTQADIIDAGPSDKL